MTDTVKPALERITRSLDELVNKMYDFRDDRVSEIARQLSEIADRLWAEAQGEPPCATSSSQLF